MTRNVDFNSIETNCVLPDWDSYGAQAVSRETVEWAKRFIDALPADIATPDIVPESDGDIGFEWYKSPTQILSVSISGGGILNYAGLFDDESIVKTEQFVTEIPIDILNFIRFMMIDKPDIPYEQEKP